MGHGEGQRAPQYLHVSPRLDEQRPKALKINKLLPYSQTQLQGILGPGSHYSLRMEKAEHSCHRSVCTGDEVHAFHGAHSLGHVHWSSKMLVAQGYGSPVFIPQSEKVLPRLYNELLSADGASPDPRRSLRNGGTYVDSPSPLLLPARAGREGVCGSQTH